MGRPATREGTQLLRAALDLQVWSAAKRYAAERSLSLDQTLQAAIENYDENVCPPRPKPLPRRQPGPGRSRECERRVNCAAAVLPETRERAIAIAKRHGCSLSRLLRAAVLRLAATSS